MKRKRIIIAHSWIEVGINNQTRQLAIALSKEHDVWFLSQSRIGAKQIKENEHLTVIEWPNKRPTKLKDLWFCIFLFRHIKPDVVMSHFSSIRVSMFGAWLAGVKNRVAWYHTLSGQLKDDLKTFWQRVIVVRRTKMAYFFANYIVALNEAGKKDAMLFLHKPAGRVKVINNGMLLPVDIAGKIWQQGEKVFLYLGRFHQSKGGDFIIKCCKAIHEKYPEFRLLLIGYGDEESTWRQIIKNEQVEGVVTMPGKVSGYNELFKFLVGAYALVVPSRIDNFPTVIIEAKACGVPAIGSRVGGIPEMIEDGANGFLCTSENGDEWISKICFLMDNPALRNKMAFNARTSFEQKFDINAHVRNVNLFLETLR
jgi:glycosyltransferase involved in cell wall biosynthesis